MNWQAALSHLTPEVLEAGAERWGAGNVRPVNLGFNHVYRGTTAAGDIALRFTHDSLRSDNALYGVKLSREYETCLVVPASDVR